MEWLNDNVLLIDPPKNPKKITGTKFAAILGKNRWQTAFEIWCDITRTYTKPFEDTIYTKAGKTIEPMQAEYIKENYFVPNLIKPEEIYGKDPFEKTRGDFFPDEKIFGGMWDYLMPGEDGKPQTVFEMKTTKRAEDWADDIPEYYALQAALYAYLLGIEEVCMVCTFLEDSDYANIENFKVTSDNTVVKNFLLHERYPNFEEDYIQEVLKWYSAHIETGLSPAYDSVKDKEIIDALSTKAVQPGTDVSKAIEILETLYADLNAKKEAIKPIEASIKTYESFLKEDAKKRFERGDKKVVYSGAAYDFGVSKTQTVKVNKDALANDGLLEKYSTVEDTYTLRKKERKSE